MEERERSPYALASEAAARLGLQLTTAEVAALASDHDMGDAELGALAVTFDYLAKKKNNHPSILTSYYLLIFGK